jgi:hypothetical protein
MYCNLLYSIYVVNTVQYVFTEVECKCNAMYSIYVSKKQ